MPTFRVSKVNGQSTTKYLAVIDAVNDRTTTGWEDMEYGFWVNSDGELVRKAVKFLQEGSATVVTNFSGWGKDNKVAVPLLAEASPK